MSQDHRRRVRPSGTPQSTQQTIETSSSQQKNTTAYLKELLDHVHSVLSSPVAETGVIENAVDVLFHELRDIRHESSKDQWAEFIKVGRAHPVCPLVHQDPFTSRAFNKPRGYAGDAVMMDYIYGREEDWQRPEASHVGSAVFNYTTSAPASAGVRERRCYVAELLDNIARQRSGQEVLAVAAGHLREAGLSLAVRRNRFNRFVAMDADAESLEEIENRYGRYGIEPVTANIRQMLTGNLDLGSFDLIYTTGLYDYLADSTAMRLTANLFDCVRPGGKLVIANFLPEIRDVGYMEMFMDWHLIYRSRGDMLKLADKIVQSTVEEIRVVAEVNENVVVMEMTKR
ncbi:class I SAM-dependent methyltransferase [Novipirellula sp. SH528]|uniref:class I SAM-dependent methyltransferase n=1 Tax=Novipirellula sp. SH528 TaxID=3454466 RepID=UPI003F9F5B5B